ncbi:acyl-CoA dehydrogenase family protein [Actinophytocola sediminis]
MEFSYPAEDLEFGRKYADWLAETVEPGWHARHPTGSASWYELQAEWDRKVYAGGWAGAFWPKEHGGLGLTPSQRIIFAALTAAADAPEGLGKIGKRLVAPLLMNYGTETQQRRHLPRITRGEEFWCQGFSEPDAGSDLASLRTRAVLDGDHFVVDGQKVWTSFAKQADWCFLLVRTDPDARKHDGISILLVPMDTEGIDIRPIKQITGSGTFNEVFFDDVRVPKENLVGELNQGWRMAVSILAHERGFEMAFGLLASVNARLDTLVRDLAEAPRDRTVAAATELGRLQARYLAAQIGAVRLLAGEAESAEPDELTSIVRMQVAELWAATTTASMLLAGPTAMVTDDGGYTGDWLAARGSTIAGGTSEIQRNIIARRVLALR